MLTKLWNLIIGADTVRVTNAKELQFMIDCNNTMREASVRRLSEAEIAGIPRPTYDSALLREAMGKGVKV